MLACTRKLVPRHPLTPHPLGGFGGFRVTTPSRASWLAFRLAPLHMTNLPEIVPLFRCHMMSRGDGDLALYLLSCTVWHARSWVSYCTSRLLPCYVHVVYLVFFLLGEFARLLSHFLGLLLLFS